jgi:hypothetical protein
MNQVVGILAPQLFLTLRQRFGEIRVANSGETAIWGSPCYANGHVRRELLSWGESYKLSCPYCNDTRFRLSVSHLYGQPDADNGNRARTWLLKCFNEDCFTDPRIRRQFAALVLGFRNRNQRCPALPVGSPSRHISETATPICPGTCVQLSRLPATHPAVRYLVEDRLFPREVLDYYSLGYCIEPDPHWGPGFGRLIFGRITIPIFFDGAYVGWQARYVGQPPNRDVPKYVTMKGMRKGSFLYNLDRAKSQPYVVVVEGVTDVWAIGDCAVAAFGKTLSRAQQLLLAEYWSNKLVVLLFDPDADEATEKQSAILERSGNYSNVVTVTLRDGRDPGSYDARTIKAVIRAEMHRAGCLPPT